MTTLNAAPVAFPPASPSAAGMRLSIMMFLQFFVWGAWYVTTGPYMEAHGLKSVIFWAYTVGPIAAIISPFFLGMIADRFFASERVLGVLHILGGVFRRGGCDDCHTSDGLGLRQSGLDLRSYTTLRTGGGRSGASIVIDRDPCASILVQKIEPGPPFGRRMPYNGPPYLSTTDIQLVRDWISEGARDN